jgi:hypothetical protein
MTLVLTEKTVTARSMAEQRQKLMVELGKISKELFRRAEETRESAGMLGPAPAKDTQKTVARLLFVRDQLHLLESRLLRAAGAAQDIVDQRKASQRYLVQRITRVLRLKHRFAKRRKTLGIQGDETRYELFQEYGKQFGVLYDATALKRKHYITVTEGWNSDEYIKRTKIVDGLADVCTRETQPIHNNKILTRRTWIFFK